MHLLGIDLGASSLKATLIDVHGKMPAMGSSNVETSHAHRGWSEQSPAEWDEAMRASLCEIEKIHGLDRVEGVSFTAGAHIVVLMDENGDILRSTILWSDQRSRPQAAELNARLSDRLLQIGHNRVPATWNLPQLAWLKQNEPETAARVRRILVAKDWLRSWLTNDFLTDRIDGEGTLMAEAGTDRWLAELCKAIDWPMETLPAIPNPPNIAGQPVWAQIIADVMNARVMIPEQGDASSGAALLAGVGIEVFIDEKDAVRRCVAFKDKLAPDAKNAALYERNFRRYQETKNLLIEIYHAMDPMDHD